MVFLGCEKVATTSVLDSDRTPIQGSHSESEFDRSREWKRRASYFLF